MRVRAHGDMVGFGFQPDQAWIGDDCKRFMGVRTLHKKTMVIDENKAAGRTSRPFSVEIGPVKATLAPQINHQSPFSSSDRRRQVT
jgi:hypothetical protein